MPFTTLSIGGFRMEPSASRAACARRCADGTASDVEPMRLRQVGVIGHDAEVGREDDAGQVSLVRAAMRQALRGLRRVRPQADRALRIGQEDGQRGAPGAGADDADLIGHAAEDISDATILD